MRAFNYMTSESKKQLGVTSTMQSSVRDLRSSAEKGKKDNVGTSLRSHGGTNSLEHIAINDL